MMPSLFALTSSFGRLTVFSVVALPGRVDDTQYLQRKHEPLLQGKKYKLCDVHIWQLDLSIHLDSIIPSQMTYG